MAYRRSNGKGRKPKKVEPAELTMNFVTPAVAGGASADFYIDLAQCASLLNRRFYRQGINFPVASIKVLASDVVGSIAIQKLPQTWVMSNAWEKGFRTWQEMNSQALEESESVRPRFLDFKIYADAEHHRLGFGANLMPRHLSQVPGGALLPSTAIAGEWESSKMRIPVGSASPGQTTDREIIAVGANYPGNGASGINAVSLIEGYAASRGLPNVLDPNAPDDADSVDGTTPANWMAATFNEGTEQKEAVINDMITENNIAPYPFENDGVNLDTMYPGGANQLTGLQIHDFDYITGTTVGGRTYLNGGLFPCGLMKISITNGNPEGTKAFDIQLNLVPGHHRGYLCEPMTEM
jgi:hypothetical protein